MDQDDDGALMDDHKTLDPAAYWRLRFLQACAEREQAQATISVQRANEAYWIALRSHGIDPQTPYRWDDESHTLRREGPNG